MALTFELVIGGANAETDPVYAETTDLATLKSVLAAHDSEDSIVSVRVTAEGEQAYRLIDTLTPHVEAGH